jgi:TolB-like protein/Tfp pilus assembly protein PilF
MSPEQVRGQKTDARSDIFSFGCVLYEMITGRRAFSEDSLPETMTAILREEPPSVASSCADVVPELDRVITRCLEKKPEQRIHSARDLAFALRDVLSYSGVSKPPIIRAAPRTPIAFGIIAAVVALILAAVFFLPREPQPAIDSLAVLPFANVTGDPETEYLSEEIPASIINSLSRLSDLRVIPRSTVFRYKGREAEPVAVGREMSIAAVLTGRISARGDNLSVRAELVDVANDRQLWGERYNRKFADLLVLEEDIAKSISEALRLRLTGEEETRLTRRYTENAEAYRAYLQGRFWWNKRSQDGLRRAIEFFDEAIRIDSTYALAYAGKADCYCLLGWYFRPPRETAPKAKEAIDAALALDFELPEAYPPLGWVRALYDWDWPGAERAFERAIELDPRYATAHHWYGCCLLIPGKLEDATREISYAHELDPGSLIISSDLGVVRYNRRQFDEAVEQLQRTVEMDSSFAPAHMALGWTYLARQEYDEAIAEFHTMHRAAGHFPRGAGLLGQAYALAGQRGKALEELRSLTELSARGLYVPAIAFATIHGALGNMDEAFEWMDKAVDERDASLPFLKIGPGFDPLRGDPRFDELVRRVGMEPAPRPTSTARPLPGKIRLAVRPIKNLSADSEQEYFCDGMTEELISQLGRLHPEGLEVIGRGSSMHYKGSDKTSGQVGRELDVDYVLEGSVRRAGDRIRILAGLTRVSNQTQLWTEDYDNRSDADVFDIQADVARRIARSLALRLLPDQRASLTRRPTANAEAHQLYLKGRHHWNRRTKDGFDKAMEYFQQAIEKDPGYALAHAGIAESYVLLPAWSLMSPEEAYPKAKAAATRALELDDTLAEAHASLACIARDYVWNWTEAERRFKQAIRLNPGYASAHQWYAEFLAYMGRHDEADAEIERALELDPLSIIIHTVAGDIAYCARKYDQAIEHCRRGLELDPNFPAAHCFLGIACQAKGMHDEAVAELRKAREVGGTTMILGYLGHVYAVAGREHRAREVLAELQELAQTEYVAADAIALIHVGLGDKDQAFAWLEKAYEQRAFGVLWLNVHGTFDRLRGDQRFDDLLRRIGLEP